MEVSGGGFQNYLGLLVSNNLAVRDSRQYRISEDLLMTGGA